MRQGKRTWRIVVLDPKNPHPSPNTVTDKQLVNIIKGKKETR